MYSKLCAEKHFENPETFQYLNATLTHPVLGQLATTRCLQILGRMRFKNTSEFLEIWTRKARNSRWFV
jgi:hypothetical protein